MWAAVQPCSGGKAWRWVEFFKNSMGESTKVMNTVLLLPGQVRAQAHGHDKAS